MSKKKAGFAVVMAQIIIFLASAGILLFDTAPTASAETASLHQKLECRIHPPEKWTEPEKWAWREICEGRNADLHRRLGHSKEKTYSKKPRYDYKWSEEQRVLSSGFLRTILLSQPFRRAIQRQGVHIIGARFQDEIRLENAIIEQPLIIEDSVFEEPVIMSRLKSLATIYLNDSEFEDELNMSFISTEGSVFMQGAYFAKVDLTAAKIKGHLALDSSEFEGELNMNFISTEGSIFIQNANFANVNLIAAKIGGELNMDSSNFKDKLNMDSISTEGSVFMGKEHFAEVNLTAAKIGGELNMDSSNFKDKLNMDSISTKGSVFIQNANFAEVNLTAAKIGGELNMDSSNFNKKTNMTFLDIGSNLFISGGSLRNLDLAGARIKGKLVLGSSDSRIKWRNSFDEDADSCCNPPIVNLRNTAVGILQDTKDSWPDNLRREFDGFTYDYLGGDEFSGGEAPYKRGILWFKEWLNRDESYSPQPYNHLAKILSTSGHGDMANEILYANREHQRAEYNPRQPKWWLLSALRAVIGHGYKYHNTLGCAGILVVIGTIILWIKKEVGKDGKRLGLWYSLDMLLPVIRLREKHYEKNIETWAKYYFYCHKILGYVLVLFLIAGLTGLTK